MQKILYVVAESGKHGAQKMLAGVPKLGAVLVFLNLQLGRDPLDLDGLVTS